MQLHVRLASGRQISVNFDGEFARVYDVATYIKLYEGINDDEVAFCRGGRWLAFDEVLHNHDDLDITFRILGGMKSNTTVSSNSDTPSGMPSSKPVTNIKGKCTVPECKKRSVLIVGDCKYCSGHFCNDHRLPEDHSCSGLDTCKAVHFNNNKTKLLSEKCVASKV